MRFLREDPWSRLEQFRQAMPNLLLQMLLRSANAVGYTNYPDNVVRTFVKQAATSGVDLFRVFDSLNWVENMRVAIDAVLETGKLCEAAICYTGNLSSPHETIVHARLLPQDGPRAQSRGYAHPWHQGHGGALPAASCLHN
jgi:pyruvate carboxylase